jgi:prolyl-tRNA synthetase
VRGDHQLNETKLSSALGTETFRPAEQSEIYDSLGAGAGSLGPVGVEGIRILADFAIQSRKNMVCGANKDDYHLGNVVPGRDFEADYFDLRKVQAGDPCDRCGESLAIDKTVEIGHIFKLGYKYSKSMGLNVLDQNGKEVPVIMGSYGIGVERIMAAAVELYHDDYGIVWPRSISPFDVVVTVVNTKDKDQVQAGEDLYHRLAERGLDCILDDRSERVGVKFKDAELIGFPVRVTVGKKLSEGSVELFSRKDQAKGECPLGDAVEHVMRMLEEYPL